MGATDSEESEDVRSRSSRVKEPFVILKVSAQRVSESATRNLSNQHRAARGEDREAREERGGGGGRERSETMLEMEVEVEEMRDSRERDW